MKCKNCGEELIDGQKFCGNCGKSVDEAAQPAVKKKSGKKKKIIIGALVVIFLMVIFTSSDDSVESSVDQNTTAASSSKENKTTEEITSAEITTTEAETTEKSVTKLSDEDKNAVRELIELNVQEDEFDNGDIKKIKKLVTEKQFYTIWKNRINEFLKDAIRPDYIADDICRYCDFYKAVWPDSKKIKTLQEYAIKLEECLDKSDTLARKIGFDSDKKQVYFGEFYITQKLEKDTVSSILEKLQPTETRDQWVAYDVEYSYFGSTPGDTVYVLSTPTNMTFPERGVYDLSYITTGDYTTLVDSSGFSKEASVIFVFSDIENIEGYINEKATVDSDIVFYFEAIKSIVNGKKVDETKPSEDKKVIKNQYKDAAPDWVFEGSVELPYKVCVDGSTLNIRSGCGSEYEVVGSLPDGCDIMVLEVYNGWAYIVGSYGVNGWSEGGEAKEIYGWVSRDYIEVIPYSPM